MLSKFRSRPSSICSPCIDNWNHWKWRKISFKPCHFEKLWLRKKITLYILVSFYCLTMGIYNWFSSLSSVVHSILSSSKLASKKTFSLVKLRHSAYTKLWSSEIVPDFSDHPWSYKHILFFPSCLPLERKTKYRG